MPEIYDIDYNLQVDNLDAPQRRLPKFKGFLYSLVKPLQLLRDFFFEDYVNGSDYPDYDNSATYNFGDRIIWTDKCVYEAASVTILGIGQSFSGVLPSDNVFWDKLNDTFIGVNERVNYNAHKLLFEYALNRFFRVAALPADQIYITNNFISPDNFFAMGDSGVFSSAMPLNSIYQDDYMPDVAAYNTNTNDYTIFVPAALFATLGSDANNREQAIRNFADLYNLAGMRYFVDTY